MARLPLLCVAALLQACSLNEYTFEPLVYDLSASPTQVTYGQTATLSWKMGGKVTALTLDGESVLGMSSTVVSPLRRQTFALTASSSLGDISTQTITIAASGLDLLAGDGQGAGNVNGVRNLARFADPSGVFAASDGIYVADRSNHLIRKVTWDGQVSTFAGLGIAGSDDGPANVARFNSPGGIIQDNSGNFFVADTSNHTIRKISLQNSLWVVSTFAGSPGSNGSIDGTGNAARFNLPIGMDMDGAGNLYVSDFANHMIRKITPQQSVSTLAGSPGNSGSSDGAFARFNYPRGVAVDGSANVFVADTGNSTLREVTQTGLIITTSTIAGSVNTCASDDGIGTAAHFCAPAGLTLDGSTLYVADASHNVIRRVAPQGSTFEVSTIAGSPGYTGVDDGSGPTARFNGPSGLSMGPSGNLYVADTGNHIVRTVTTPAGSVTTLAGSVPVTGNTDGTGAGARFSSPFALASDGQGSFYVADAGNHAIRRVTSTGVVSTFAGSPGNAGSNDGAAATARFNYPTGVAVDGTGNLYVADSGNHTIRQVTSNGMVSTLAGSPGLYGSVDGTGSAARFWSPAAVAVDAAGNVYVADPGNHLIRKVSPLGTVSTLAGFPQICGSSDGTGGAARFCYPLGIGVDGSGTVYVADTYNETLRKVSPAGVVGTLAGSAGTGGSSDGTGAAARFDIPTGLTLDSFGNIYLADRENHTIRKITPTGTVTTIAGTARLGVVAPGPLPAKLSFPSGIALTPAGDLVVSSCNAIVQVTAF